MEAYLSFTRFRNGIVSDDVMKEAAASAAWTAACDLLFTLPLPLELLSVEDRDTLGAIVYCNCLWCNNVLQTFLFSVCTQDVLLLCQCRSIDHDVRNLMLQ